MQCPKCGAGLNHLVISVKPKYGDFVLNNAHADMQIVADQCLSCNGVWMNANDLNEYLQEKVLLIESPSVPQTPAYNKITGSCPKCQKPMSQERFKNVLVDRCPVCHGVWLDGGELDHVEDKSLKFAERWRYMVDRIKEGWEGQD